MNGCRGMAACTRLHNPPIPRYSLSVMEVADQTYGMRCSPQIPQVGWKNLLRSLLNAKAGSSNDLGSGSQRDDLFEGHGIKKEAKLEITASD